MEPEYDALVDEMNQRIAREGHQIVVVGATDSHPMYGYTVGLSTEYMLRGLAPDALGEILNRLARLPTIERPFLPGLCYVGGTFPVKLVSSLSPEGWGFARHFHRSDDFSRLLVLVSDTDGRYPDDPECDELYRKAQGFA